MHNKSVRTTSISLLYYYYDKVEEINQTAIQYIVILTVWALVYLYIIQ